MAMYDDDGEALARFYVESRSDSSVMLDRLFNGLFVIEENLVVAANLFARMVKEMDADETVEVMVVGTGLAMAGLLTAQGVRVQCSHAFFPDPVPDEDFDYEDM